MRLLDGSQASVELAGEYIWNMPRSKEPGTAQQTREIAVILYIDCREIAASNCDAAARDGTPSFFWVDAAEFSWLQEGMDMSSKKKAGRSCGTSTTAARRSRS